MISQALVQQIERHSHRLTQEVLAAVRNDARAKGFERLPDSDLRESLESLFQYLGRWLTSRTDYAVESRYRRIGRERRRQGIPLSQLIFAFGLVRSTMNQFLRSSTMGTAGDLYLEHELALSIHEFIEKAVYYASLGYEDAQAAQHASPEARDIDVSGLEFPPIPTHWDPESEWDPHVSRAGDVGEVSG
jgi:hypothetical protein